MQPQLGLVGVVVAGDCCAVGVGGCGCGGDVDLTVAAGGADGADDGLSDVGGGFGGADAAVMLLESKSNGRGLATLTMDGYLVAVGWPRLLPHKQLVAGQPNRWGSAAVVADYTFEESVVAGFVVVVVEIFAVVHTTMTREYNRY